MAAIAIATPFAVHTARADDPAEIAARAGGGEAGYSVNLYLPQAITIHTGDTITFSFDWFEPHSVTFGTPTGDPTAPSVPLDAPYVFDGTGYFSSGLLGEGFTDVTTFSVEFAAAGDYEIYCAIHPFMTGDITVIDSGDVPTQEELDATGDTEYETELAAAKAAAAVLAAAPVTSTNNGDGTKTYDAVVSGALMNSDVMQYFPPSLTIHQGDSVRFTNSTPVPHTVSFNPQDYPGGDPFESEQTSLPNGFDGSGFANSGIIGQDFPLGQTFEMKFTTPGTFTYVCLLHSTEGMVGDIVVQAATAPSPTPTQTAPQPPATGSGHSGGSNTMLAFYLAGIAFVLIGGSAVMAARRS